MFFGRAVTWLVRQGIRQFIDAASGLPTAHNTHEAAQAADSSCRVVYADNDPVVVNHAKALLTGIDVAAIWAGLAHPASLLADPAIAKLIRPSEPTGIVLAMVLHFFDAATARKIVAGLVDWSAPGSYVVISVGSGDDETGGRLAAEYKAGTLYNHSPREVAEFFAGIDLVAPGLTDARGLVSRQPAGGAAATLRRPHPRGGRLQAS